MSLSLAMLSRVFHEARRLRRRRLGGRVRGQGLEFGAHRDYSPGDDLRRLDWQVYARLSRLVIKLTEDLPEPRLELVVDASPSMACGQPSPMAAARGLAAALAAFAMGRGAAARVRDGAPGASTPGATTPGATAPGATAPGATAPGATAPGPETLRGEARLGALAAACEALRTSERADLRAACEPLRRLSRRGVVILSDGLGEAGELVEIGRRLRHAGQAVFVLLLRPEAELAGGEGWMWLVDAETGEAALRAVDEAVLRDMAARRRALVGEALRGLEAAGLGAAVASTARPVEQTLRQILRQTGAPGQSLAGL